MLKCARKAAKQRAMASHRKCILMMTPYHCLHITQTYSDFPLQFTEINTIRIVFATAAAILLLIF